MARTDTVQDDQAAAAALADHRRSAATKVVSVVDTVREAIALEALVAVTLVAAVAVPAADIHLVDQIKYQTQFSNSMRQTVATNTKQRCCIRSCIWFLFLRLKL